MDLLQQYREEINGKVVYFKEHLSEEDNEMEWSDSESATGKTYVGQNNCEDVARKEFDTTGLVADKNCDMEWSDIEPETGKTYVGQNNCEDVAGKCLM